MASSTSRLAHGSSWRGSEETEKAGPQSTTSTTPSKTENTPQTTFISRTKQHLLEPVRPSLLTEIELLVLTFCTGIQDAVSFPDYHCFASNQTGNTIFLALALVLPQLNGDAFYTANIAVALTLFLAGGSLTGQLAHLAGPRRRAWLLLCNALQTLLVLAAAAATLQRQPPPPRRPPPRPPLLPPTGPAGLAAIALLAFASGSQVVQSRSLACTEISTAMATAAWVDLLVDRRLFGAGGAGGAGSTRPRNRRLAFLAVLVAGTLAGAGIYRAAGSAAALFVSAGGKAVVTGMFWLNGADDGEKVAEEAV